MASYWIILFKDADGWCCFAASLRLKERQAEELGEQLQVASLGRNKVTCFTYFIFGLTNKCFLGLISWFFILLFKGHQANPSSVFWGKTNFLEAEEVIMNHNDRVH